MFAHRGGKSDRVYSKNQERSYCTQVFEQLWKEMTGKFLADLGKPLVIVRELLSSALKPD